MINRTPPFILAAAALSLPVAASADHHAKSERPLHVTVIGGQGQALGMATFEQTPAGVLINVAIEGLSEGEHAFHIHETGVCDPAAGFKSAGGHYAPGDTAHGFKVAAGPHAGDMPNQFVSSDGKLRAQVINRSVTMGEGDSTVMDADGSALVIHEGADDYTSQPSGAAGARVACAVIAAPR